MTPFSRLSPGVVMLFLSTCTMWPPVTWALDTITLDQASQAQEVAAATSYFIDESNNLSVEQVRKRFMDGSFQTVTNNNLSLGFHSNAQIWIRFQIDNPTDIAQLQLLEAAGHLIRTSSAYQMPVGAETGQTAPITNSEIMPIENPWSRHLYALSVDPGASSEVFVAYQSKAAFRLSPRLYSETGWNSKTAATGLRSGLYFGAMFMVLMLMVFRALRYQSKVDWFYVFYITALSLSAFFTRGIHQQLGIDMTQANAELAVYLAGIVAIPSMGGFTRTFISWPKHKRKPADRALVVVLGLFLLTAWLTWSTDPSQGFKFLNLAALTLVVSLLAAGLWATVAQYANAKFFLLAFSPFLLTILWRVLEGLGVITQSDHGMDLYFITSFLHAALLSGAVVIRATSIKAAQERLKTALDEAESNMQHQHEWFQMLSHEIRTPISIIANHTQLAEKALDSSTSVRAHIKSISAGVNRLSATVTQFLSIQKWSRSTAYAKEVFNVSDLLQKLITNAQHQTQDHILTFNSQACDCQVYADKSLVTIAVQNIVDNAIKYSPEGGAIEITLSKKSPERLGLAVTDEGVGIHASQIEKIFERYYRINRVEGTIGTGLGLYIAKAIIEMHQGTLSCHSVVGEGTTFEVVLPCTTQH